MPSAFYLLLALAPLATSDIDDDDKVVFYPTFAAQTADPDETPHWEISLHGNIFEPERNSIKRALLVKSMRSLLDIEKNTTKARLLNARLHDFMVDHERNKTIRVRMLASDGTTVEYPAGTSAANGHFSRRLTMSLDEADRFAHTTANGSRWLHYEAVTEEDDTRRFVGRTQLIPPQGVSVISDIDDTIKISNVRNKSEVLANTFTRPYRAVGGMAKLYAQAAQRGVVFHYVSGSPWQLQESLAAFFATAGFPMGSMHLKQFRLTDSSVLNLLTAQTEHKLTRINAILAAFPERRFILVGDTGEQDPEIYGQVARAHPDQVVGVFLRNVTNERADNARLSEAMQSVYADSWSLFKKTDEIADQFTKQQ